MKTTRFLIFAAALIVLDVAIAPAQAIIQTKPDIDQTTQSRIATLEDDNLIRAVFDPITDDLKLTPAQKVQIATIARDTVSRSEIFFEQIDRLEDLLSVAAFTGQIDENKIRQLSDKQATLFAEIIAMKARAKVGFHEILTAEQRAMIVEQYRLRTGENNLGAISNFDQ